MHIGYLKKGMYILLLLTIGFAPMTEAGAQQNRVTVLIDPAHGGEEAGVVFDKLREKDLTLNLAMLIRQEAQKTGNIQVQLSRTSDKMATLQERIKIINDLKPDCILSLHVNAGFGKMATGYEVYFPGFLQAVSAGGESSAILKDMEKNRYINDSVRLAQRIQANLETVFPRKGRGLRDAPNPLFDGLTIPGLVVEVGFATHPEDRKQLTDGASQKAVSAALLKGLRDYFQKAP
jgi:N-acetylmuramoyl-L-alanine amidase